MWVPAHAQDRVVLRGGSAIEAKVIEVSSQSVRFHRADNLEGPLYTYDVCDIEYIRYSNGAVDRFTPCDHRTRRRAAGEAPLVSETTLRILTSREQIGNRFIMYNGAGMFLMNNRMITPRLARGYIAEYCPEALPDFNKGISHWQRGSGMAWGGVTASSVGVGMLLVGILKHEAAKEEAQLQRTYSYTGLYGPGSIRVNTNEQPRQYLGLKAGGVALTLIGAIISLAAIDDLNKAADYFSRSVVRYNEVINAYGDLEPRMKPAWSWAFYPTGTGLGLSVYF